MSEEDALRKLEEFKKQREQSYLLLKGQIQGIRLQKLSPQGLAFVAIYEMMIDENKKVWDALAGASAQQIRTIEKVSNLERKIKELENNIQQIRQALDEEFHLFRAR